MMHAAAVLAFVVFLPVLAFGQANPAQTYDLGSLGEVPHWLMLGYFPLAIDQNAFDKDLAVPGKVLDTDVLAGAGGEAKVAPVGGQKVTIAASAAVKAPLELTWRLANTVSPEMITTWNMFQRLPLFYGDKPEQALEKTGCYLYCQLLAPADMTADFMLGSDDSVKVVLNGQVVHRFLGQRSAGADEDKVPVRLRKGANDLLVRVDNYVSNGAFIGRFVDAKGDPITGVKVQLAVPAGTPELPPEQPPSWAKRISLIPPVSPVEHQDLFGGRLTRTMSLLENGGQTHRPVRIVFYGQSIETEWTLFLIQRLRERYPNTQIIAENQAIGGWGVFLLVKSMWHDILYEKPDLVVFHAYGGSAQQWERFLCNVRRMTTAEILVRTAHVDGGEAKALGPVETQEVLMLRDLAQKYDVELVDLRREWLVYLKENNLKVGDLLADQVHLNVKGNVLMAELYERHFRVNTLGHGGWMKNVRWYGVMTPLEDHRTDEIVLTGSGWTARGDAAQSIGAGNSLKLKFRGTRLDLVLKPDTGSAKVLIDGKAPSQLNLYHGTRAAIPVRKMNSPAYIVRYHCGPNMVAEKWEMTIKDISPDGRKFRFSVRGSATGDDGEGSNTETFKSKSGRITIYPDDWLISNQKYEPQPGQGAPRLAWQVVGDFLDQVQCQPAPARQYVTVADGLTPGKHELTLIPNDGGSFSIEAAEAHNPPLAGK